MKAWEVLKLLQEGKLMSRKKWGEGSYIRIIMDDDGNFPYGIVVDEETTVLDVGDVLSDSDDWYEYKE